MVKKNLKHALRAHEAKKAQVNKLKAVEEAVKRKALSIKSGKQPSRQKKKSEHSIKTYVRPFLKDDTILLVGEGEHLSHSHIKWSWANICSDIQATSPLLTHF
jgi:hypothetical protein